MNHTNIYLAEVCGKNLTTGTLKWLRASTGVGFITRPTDTVPNQIFYPSIINQGNFERHLFSSGEINGRSVVGRGAVEIVNDGMFDWVADYAFDGQEIVIWRGSENGVFPDDFSVVLRGTMAGLEPRLTKIIITIRDNQAIVSDLRVQPLRYGGTNTPPNGVDGSQDLEGRVRPLAFGICKNVSPKLVNSSKLIYELSSNQLASVDEVYVAGLDVAAGVSRSTVADLEANAPASGHYDYALTSSGSYIRLGFQPSGYVTADLTASGSAIISDVAQSILTGPGGLTSSDLYLSAFTSMATAYPWDISLFIDDDMTVGQALDAVMNSCGGWWGVRRDGKFTIGDLLSPISPVDWEVPYDLILDGLEVSTTDTVIWRTEVTGEINYTALSEADIAGAVTPERRDWLLLESRMVVDEDSSILNTHVLAEPLTHETLLSSRSNMSSLASILLDRQGVSRWWVRVPIPSDNCPELELGSVISLPIERYGLSGKLFRLLGQAEDHGSGKIWLELWG